MQIDGHVLAPESPPSLPGLELHCRYAHGRCPQPTATRPPAIRAARPAVAPPGVDVGEGENVVAHRHFEHPPLELKPELVLPGGALLYQSHALGAGSPNPGRRPTRSTTPLAATSPPLVPPPSLGPESRGVPPGMILSYKKKNGTTNLAFFPPPAPFFLPPSAASPPLPSSESPPPWPPSNAPLRRH